LDVGESGHLLRQALIDGEEVAIIGFGPIGLAALQTAQLYSPAAIIPACRIGLAPD
jgi:threonine dehydrogenase-like Zn-dependent dehydrogenase